MSNQQNSEANQNRKNFAIGLSAIGALLAIASASSTYSVNYASFSDWPGGWAKLLAVFATVGIEVMFVLIVYGLAYALTGAMEKTVGIVGLCFLLFVMATNFVIHRQHVKGVPLSEWQQSYDDWAGSLSLFGVLILIVLFGAVSYEAQERRLQRDIEFLSRKRALEWKKEALQSEAFTAHLDAYRPQVFEEAKKQLRLPEAPITGKGTPGFVRGADDYDPKQ